MLILPQELLEATIQRCLETGKLTRQPDGTLYVTNWEEYNFTDRHHRRIAQRKLEAEAETDEEEADVRNSDTPVRKEDRPIISYNILSSSLEEGGPGETSSISEDQEKQIKAAALEVLPPGFVETRILPAIRALQDEFKLKDPVEAFKKKTAWWRDKPATLRGNLTLQLRNWWRIEAEMEAKDRAPLEVGRNREPEKPQDQKYKEARKKKFEEIIEALKPELEKAREAGDQATIDRLEEEIKGDMAEFSRTWHEKQEGK
jgi:hypothetical protein